MSSFDPIDTQEQDRQRASLQQREQLIRESEAADFKWLMGGKRGRRIVWRQLERAGVFRSSFNTNAMSMAFAEGGRNEGLRTLSSIHSLCPELYAVMVKENSHDNRNPDDSGRTNQ